jgi:leucyl-tRNA synthetase
MRRVTQDFETRWHFNSAIAQIMELTNEIYAAEPLEKEVRPEIRKEILQILTLLLAPMTPHIAEEMWEMLGNTGGLSHAPWPVLVAEQQELAKDDEVEVVVQVSGRVRGKLKLRAGTTQDEVVALAKVEASVVPHLTGKRIVKIIFVADKLVNLVVA